MKRAAASLLVLALVAGAVQAQTGPAALAAAIAKRQPDTVATLIERGADVNAAHDGLTPLYRAELAIHPGIMQLLIAKGADVNAPSDDPDLPLRAAYAFGNFDGAFEIIETLMARSAGPAARTAQKLSPLHVASRPETIRLLLERGARVDARDVAGNTPLFWACLHNNQSAADLLLQRGADINARNAGGLTPLDAALAMRHPMLDKWLRARGAKAGTGRLTDELSSADLHLRLERARSPLTAFVLSRRNDEAALDMIMAWQDTRLLQAYVPEPFSIYSSKFRMSREKLELLQPALMQRWPSDRAKDHMVRQISRSGLPGIEQPLLEALPLVTERSRREIEEQLAERRYEPVLPYIAERLSDPDHERCRNLALIGSTTAAREMVRCLGRLTSLGRRGHDEVLAALAKQGGIPEVDFVALRMALPRVMDEKTSVRYFEVIALHQPASEVPVLVAAMRDNPAGSWLGTAARGALARFESEELQQQVTGELGRLAAAGKIEQAPYQYVIGRYAEFRRLPAQYKLAIRKKTAYLFARDKEPLDRIKHAAELRRETRPELYVREYDAYLAQVVALADKYQDSVHHDGLRAEAAQGYKLLADFVRFKLNRPSQALAFQAKSAQVSPAVREHDYWSDLVAADVFQFDLKDRAKAIEAYRRAAERLPRAQIGPVNWLGRALAHEVKYLESGKPFSGSIRTEELGQFLGMVVLAAAGAFGEPAVPVAALPLRSMSAAERRALEDRLEGLAPSHLNFLKAAPLLSLFSTEQSVLRFLHKHDPGGYWSASLALLVLHPEALGERGAAALLPGMRGDAGKAAALRAAAGTFVRQRGISLQPPDGRRATPEKTWQLLQDSLRAGDADTALGCFTPRMRARLEPLFGQMAPAAMREMADSFTAFSMQEGTGEVREAVLTRKIDGQPQRAGFAYFVRYAGEWKIDEM